MIKKDLSNSDSNNDGTTYSFEKRNYFIKKNQQNKSSNQSFAEEFEKLLEEGIRKPENEMNEEPKIQEIKEEENLSLVDETQNFSKKAANDGERITSNISNKNFINEEVEPGSRNEASNISPLILAKDNYSKFIKDKFEVKFIAMDCSIKHNVDLFPKKIKQMIVPKSGDLAHMIKLIGRQLNFRIKKLE